MAFSGTPHVDYARTHPPAVVFIDEIDAIGSKRRENVLLEVTDDG